MQLSESEEKQRREHFEQELSGEKWSLLQLLNQLILTLFFYQFIQVNPMFKCLQYLMGFVTLGAFSGLHAYNPGCTKYDEALAFFSSITAYYTLYLSFLAVGQVVIPGEIMLSMSVNRCLNSTVSKTLMSYVFCCNPRTQTAAWFN